jgi:hypothetical protein
MKILFLIGLFIAPSAALFGQNPDCQFAVTFTGAGRQGTAASPGTTASAFPSLSSATGVPCVAWHVTYQTIGTVTVSLSFQGANDTGILPGMTYTTMGPACPITNPCNIVTGTNPLTDPVQSFLSVTGYFPWVSLLMNTCTGCNANNTVVVKIIGFRAFNAPMSLSGTTTVAIGPGTSNIGKVDILGNVGGILDSPTGTAVPANALQIGYTDGTNLRVPFADPCTFRPHNYFVISVTVNTQIVAGVAANNVYICQFFLAPAPGGVDVNIVESTTSGNACATSPVGMMGGPSAALGANLSTNGGFVLPFAGGRSWMKTATAGDAVCIFTTAQVSGVLTWVQNNP